MFGSELMKTLSILILYGTASVWLVKHMPTREESVRELAGLNDCSRILAVESDIQRVNGCIEAVNRLGATEHVREICGRSRQ